MDFLKDVLTGVFILLIFIIYLGVFYFCSVVWCHYWVVDLLGFELGKGQYLNLSLAYDGPKQMPYYLLHLHAFFAEFFGVDPTRLTVDTFVTKAPIYVCVILTPVISLGVRYSRESAFPKEE